MIGVFHLKFPLRKLGLVVILICQYDMKSELDVESPGGGDEASDSQKEVDQEIDLDNVIPDMKNRRRYT